MTVEPSTTEGLRSLDEVVATLERFDVSGQVVDKNGRPVRKADVFLYYARGRDGLRDRLAGKTRTDRKGHFKFEKAVVWEPITETKSYQPSRYGIVARHPKHGIDFAILLQEDERENVQITLGGPKFVNITVKDLEGRPVPGASVYMSGGEHPRADRDHRYLRLYQDIGVSSGTTDEHGTVKLMRPPGPGFYAEKDGFVRGTLRGKQILLFPSAQVSGKATFEDGSPAAGAAVWFSYHGNRLVWSDATLTDSEGNYVFENVPGAGFYTTWSGPQAEQQEKSAVGEADLLLQDLRAGSPFKSQKVAFRIKPGDKLTKDLVLKPGVVFAGKVVDLVTNQLVPNMRMVMLIQTTGRYLDSYEVNADENGEFRATAAPGSLVSFQWEDSRTGDYIIDQEWLRQNNYQAFRGVVTEDITDLVFRVKLWPVNTLTGRVVNERNEGVGDVSVYIHSSVPPIKTDDSGAFTLKVAPKERDFALLAVSEDEAHAGLVELKASTTQATIPLEPAVDYEGQVLNTEGLPADNLSFLFQPSLKGQALYRMQRRINTDADGRFTVEHVHPRATYHVFWFSDNESNRDYAGGNATVDLSKLKPGERVTFEAKQCVNALLGRVLNEQEEPLEGARVDVISFDMVAGSAGNQEIKSDKNGEFVAQHLAPGEVMLRISAKGYKSRTVRSASDSIDFETTLKPVSEDSLYEVTVVDDEGNPVAEAPLSLWLELSERGEKTSFSQATHASAEGKGEFSLTPASDKTSGSGFIGCDLEGYDLAYHGVRPNEGAELLLVLHKGGEHWTGRVVDEGGKPIAGARVRVVGMRPGKDYGAHARFGDQLDFTYLTDEDGRFDLSRFGRKDGVSLQLSAEGYAREDEWLIPDRDSESTFQLSAGAAVRGKVIVKETGKPLPSARIELSNLRWESREYEVGEAGTFSADDLRPGQYAVEFSSGATGDRKYVCLSPTSFDVAAGETAEVTLEVEEGIPVRGKMIDAETGSVPEGRGTVFAEADGEHVAYCNVDEDGSWQLYVPAGTFELKYYTGGLEESKTLKSITIERGKVYDGLLIEVDTQAN